MDGPNSNDVEGQGKWLVVPRGQAWGCFLCGKVDRRSRSSHVPFLLLLRALLREKTVVFFGRFVKQEDSSRSRSDRHIQEYQEYNRVTAISSPYEQEPG